MPHQRQEPSCSPAPSPAGLFVVAGEILLAATLVLIGGWADRGSRSSGPESAFAAYAAAVARGDLAVALDQLAPDLRPGAEPFVAYQLGNRYIVLESAVRTQSAVDRWLRKAASPTTVAMALEVQNEDGSQWRTTEEMPVAPADGRWYLLRVPLEPTRGNGE